LCVSVAVHVVYVRKHEESSVIFSETALYWI